jgi:hypothetical protein
VQKALLGYNQGESPSTATLDEEPCAGKPHAGDTSTLRQSSGQAKLSTGLCGAKGVREEGENPMAMTFEQVIEMIRQFPDEQQEMLVDLIRGWRTETRRREIARDARESLAAFRSGQLKPQSAQAVITELRQSLEDQE